MSGTEAIARGVYEAGEYGMERVSFHGDAGTETDVHDKSYL